LSLGEDIIRKKHILARDFLPNPGEKTGHHKPTSQRHEQCFFVPRKHKRKRGVNELRNLHEIYGQGTPRKYSNLAQEQSHEISHLRIPPVINQDAGSSCSWFLAWTPLPTAGDLRRNTQGEVELGEIGQNPVPH
jgi:hypothetical protein